MAKETKKRLEEALERAKAMKKTADDAKIRLERISVRAKYLNPLMSQALKEEDFDRYEKLRKELDKMPEAVHECNALIEGDPAVMVELLAAWEAYREEIHTERKKTAAGIETLIKEIGKKLLPDLELLDEANELFRDTRKILGYNGDVKEPKMDASLYAIKPLLTSVLKAEGYDHPDALALCASVCYGNHEDLAKCLDAMKKDKENYFSRHGCFVLPLDTRQYLGDPWYESFSFLS